MIAKHEKYHGLERYGEVKEVGQDHSDGNNNPRKIDLGHKIGRTDHTGGCSAHGLREKSPDQHAGIVKQRIGNSVS